MKQFLLLIFFASSFLVNAQTTSKAYQESLVYAQLDVGIFPHFELLNGEISAAVGYRFSEAFGLGVEYRSTSTHNVSFGKGANVLGLQLRGQFWDKVIVNTGFGAVLDAYHGNDSFEEYRYWAGGHYMAVDVAYQTRWGLTLGLYLTSVQGVTFDIWDWNFDTSTHFRTDASFEESFASLGLKIGYAFPARGKRRKH